MDSPIFEVPLGEEKVNLRADIGSLRQLQKQVGGLIGVARKFVETSITSDEMAAIVWHCAEDKAKLKAFGSVEAVEQVLLEHGIMNVMKPCADFIKYVLQQGSKGKAPVTKENP